MYFLGPTFVKTVAGTVTTVDVVTPMWPRVQGRMTTSFERTSSDPAPSRPFVFNRLSLQIFEDVCSPANAQLRQKNSIEKNDDRKKNWNLCQQKRNFLKSSVKRKKIKISIKNVVFFFISLPKQVAMSRDCPRVSIPRGFSFFSIRSAARKFDCRWCPIWQVSGTSVLEEKKTTKKWKKQFRAKMND